MAAMIRTSTDVSSLPPTLRISFSWIARSSLTCIVGDVSEISSRKSVPPSASAKRPRFSLTAPVKAPRSWPKSSDSRRVSGSAPQLIETNFFSLRMEVKWIARAISSLPVPLSPVISTVEVTLPMRSIVRKISCIREPLPMMLAKVYLAASSCLR